MKLSIIFAVLFVVFAPFAVESSPIFPLFPIGHNSGGGDMSNGGSNGSRKKYVVDNGGGSESDSEPESDECTPTPMPDCVDCKPNKVQPIRITKMQPMNQDCGDQC